MLDTWVQMASKFERAPWDLEEPYPVMRNVEKTVYSVQDFLSWQRAKTLELSPNFQRRAVWSPAAKSYFIDTLVRSYPIPIVFLRAKTNLDTLEPLREVVDGQQRLRTILSFIDPASLGTTFDPERDSFQIKKSHNKDLAGKSFSEFPADIRRRILAYAFSVHVLPSDTEDREVLQIFGRMNATGVRLNDQELRNASYYGEFKQLAYNLAYEHLTKWRSWKLFNESAIARMSEVEQTSELMIFMLGGIRGKNQKSITKFYVDYEENFPASDEIAKRFRVIMSLIDDTIGKEIPKMVYSTKTMFETLFCFYYSHVYSIGDEMTAVKPKPLPSLVPEAAIRASQIIQDGELDDDLMKFLRGAPTHKEGRQARLQFMERTLEDAARLRDLG